ncbi:MAG: hypothetical protein ACREEM_24310 [Blastocatellia bacterium]
MLNAVVFAEAASDAEIVCGLSDRIFNEIGNIPREELPDCRNWLGHESNATFIEKNRITYLSNQLKEGSKRPRSLGHIDGKPQGSYTAFWRKAIELVVAISKSQPVAGVLIHCDVDTKYGQHKDIEQACNPDRPRLKFVLATPDREMEAWLLNGFIPENPAEKKLLAAWKRKLKFAPCTEAERASIGDRDPKKIINDLTNDNDERKRQCWYQTALSDLRRNGQNTNLAKFLDEVETSFLPLLSI